MYACTLNSQKKWHFRDTFINQSKFQKIWEKIKKRPHRIGQILRNADCIIWDKIRNKNGIKNEKN